MGNRHRKRPLVVRWWVALAGVAALAFWSVSLARPAHVSLAGNGTQVRGLVSSDGGVQSSRNGRGQKVVVKVSSQVVQATENPNGAHAIVGMTSWTGTVPPPQGMLWFLY